MSSGKILIVDDDPQLRQLLGDRLTASGFHTLFAETGKQGIAQVRESSPDAVLLDLQMPEMDGMEALSRLRELNPDLPVIILTAHGTLSRAVEAMKAGAYDFLPKPCDSDHLLVVVRKALESKALRTENLYLKAEIADRYRLIFGENQKMKEAMTVAEKVAPSTATVLVQGESGTGKLLMAHAIHVLSDRKTRPFIQVNCTTLSEALLESDLFGHERGAFTGAHQTKKGRVELAHGGTLFLDEIGDLSLGIQAKLLHFLEHGEFERVGGTATLHVDARVIAATHRDLERRVKEGEFREDLFYRLNVVTLAIPPLRDRPEDIPLLAHHFLERFSSQMGKRISAISDSTMETLKSYHWPGNVRELQNAIERAVVLATGDEITLDLLPPQISAVPREEIAVGMALDEALRRFKRDFIAKTLEFTVNNQAKAAAILKIQRTYLNRLVKELRFGE